MKIIRLYPLILLTAVAIISACATSTQRAQATATAQGEVSSAVTTYENQFVQAGQPFATISGAPRPVDSQLLWSPYRVQTLNAKKLELAPFSLHKQKALPRDYAFSALKIPPGSHDLTVWGGDSRQYKTSFKNINFDTGKSYAIVEKVVVNKDEDEVKVVFIAEYKSDARFTSHEKEHYLIGKRVSQLIELKKDIPYTEYENTK